MCNGFDESTTPDIYTFLLKFALIEQTCRIETARTPQAEPREPIKSLHGCTTFPVPENRPLNLRVLPRSAVLAREALLSRRFRPAASTLDTKTSHFDCCFYANFRCPGPVT